MRRIISFVLLAMTSLAIMACDSETADRSGASASYSSAPTTQEAELQERIEELEARQRKEDAAEARRKRREARERRERRRERQRKLDAASAQVTDTRGGGITVPNVVGLDHQAAQDASQGEGLLILDEKDCTGQSRVMLWNRNWEVVSVEPPAGSQVSEDTTVTLCSKKQGE